MNTGRFSSIMDMVAYVVVRMRVLASWARGWDVNTAAVVSTRYSPIYFLSQSP